MKKFIITLWLSFSIVCLYSQAGYLGKRFYGGLGVDFLPYRTNLIGLTYPASLKAEYNTVFWRFKYLPTARLGWIADNSTSLELLYQTYGFHCLVENPDNYGDWFPGTTDISDPWILGKSRFHSFNLVSKFQLFSSVGQAAPIGLYISVGLGADFGTTRYGFTTDTRKKLEQFKVRNVNPNLLGGIGYQRVLWDCIVIETGAWMNLIGMLNFRLFNGNDGSTWDSKFQYEARVASRLYTRMNMRISASYLF